MACDHPKDNDSVLDRRVPCPCKGCAGALCSDGRDVNDGLTFLECDACQCTFVARDFESSPRGHRTMGRS